MKQKRNNNIVTNPGINPAAGLSGSNNNRDGSNDPLDNQRVDTGGGEYLQNDDD
jgi:hypothetical protein